MLRFSYFVNHWLSKFNNIVHEDFPLQQQSKKKRSINKLLLDHVRSQMTEIRRSRAVLRPL